MYPQYNSNIIKKKERKENMKKTWDEPGAGDSLLKF
jgi:hypothetical protein